VWAVGSLDEISLMPGSLAAFQSAIADRYAIRERLGEGGMAIVFLAHDLRHDRAVAVKVLRPEIAAALGPDRFLREIRFAADLTHPHIVPLFDSGIETMPGHPALPYYVMPRVPGETLRDRIARDGALPVETAVSIAREVGQALAYAHGHGIVHRDIKPANILLTGETAMVADFGIARALDQAGESDRITDSGLTLGTPAYMAPEQTTADVQLDGRADVYALGCVLYEMLGGSPPFTGANAAAVLARHRTDPPPPLRTLRPTVPASLEAVVLRALAKAPADRFQSAAELVRALSPGSGSFGAIDIGQERGRARRRFLLGGALLVTAAAAGAMYLRPESGEPASTVALGAAGTARELDDYRFAVAPFEFAPLVLDALARWDGVSLVDERQMLPDGRRTDDSDRARAAAHGAGRLVRGQVERSAGTLRISAQLIDTKSGDLIRRNVVHQPAGAAADSAVAALVATLVLGSAAAPRELESPSATRSLPARHEFAAGVLAMNAWDLPRAAEHFAGAARHDPGYAQALVLEALTRAWSGAPAAEWRSSAERARTGRARLSAPEAAMTDAVLATARDDLVGACAIWRDLAQSRPDDFLAWYGWGDCQSRDDTVLRDPGSVSGWRFRTSYRSAMQAYRRALELQPSIHGGLSEDGFDPISNLLKLRPTSIRFGDPAGPDGTLFGALPGWDGDSLSYVPWPIDRLPTPATLLEAVQHQRELFHEIATAWTTALPQSATAFEALGFSRELLGRADALAIVQRAGRLSTEPRERARIAAREVWMRIRRAAPDDSQGLAAARRAADSILGSPGAAGMEARSRASLSILLGRLAPALAAYAEPEVQRQLDVPPSIFPLAPRLVLAAALGSPPDTLRQLEQRLLLTIDRALPEGQRHQARLQWGARAATLAYPAVRLRSAPTLAGQGDYLLDAMELLHRGDSADARRVLADRIPDLRAGRFAERPADAVYPEAWLLAAAGDVPAAIAWLDQLLLALPEKAPRVVTEPIEAAALVRAMALRAELAARVGDAANARRWSRAIALLWSGADDQGRGIVHRMEAPSR
jgi:tetratricopeptide (TPR) repeat protein